MNKEPEKWVDIIGYEGLYSVSNLGRIVSHHKGLYRFLHPTTHPNNGYSCINLCKNGKVRMFRVHTLVAKHFIPNPEHLSEVNHKDEDKLNNRADNLEWCTRSYNINYGTGIERRRAKLSKPVRQYSKTGEYIRLFDSITQASQTLGIHSANIVKCCKQIRPNAGGFVWKYITEA
jgi:hypothetical protein